MLKAARFTRFSAKIEAAEPDSLINWILTSDYGIGSLRVYAATWDISGAGESMVKSVARVR